MTAPPEYLPELYLAAISSRTRLAGRLDTIRKRYCSFSSLIKTGDLYGEQFCYHELPEVLDPFDNETFTNDPLNFYVGASDIETGEAVFHKCYDGRDEDLTWMRASASMPVVSRIVEIDGRKLLDGGIVCPVPYEFMESMGYDRNIIILTQPEDFVKEKAKTLPLIRVVSAGQKRNRMSLSVYIRKDAGSRPRGWMRSRRFLRSKNRRSLTDNT